MSVETPTLTPTPTLPFWGLSEVEILWSLHNQKPTPSTPTTPLCPPGQNVVHSACPNPQDNFSLENAPPGPLNYDPATGTCYFCETPNTPSTTPDKYAHLCSDPSACGCYVDPGGGFDSLADCEADYEATKCGGLCAPECCDRWTWSCTGDPECGCFQEVTGAYDTEADCNVAYDVGKTDLTMCDEACACEDCVYNPAVPDSNCGSANCSCDCSFCQQGGAGYISGQCGDDCWYNVATHDTNCDTAECPCSNTLCQNIPPAHNPCVGWDMYASEEDGCGCFDVGGAGKYKTEAECNAVYNGYLSECGKANPSFGFFFEFNSGDPCCDADTPSSTPSTPSTTPTTLTPSTTPTTPTTSSTKVCVLDPVTGRPIDPVTGEYCDTPDTPTTSSSPPPPPPQPCSSTFWVMADAGTHEEEVTLCDGTEYYEFIDDYVSFTEYNFTSQDEKECPCPQGCAGVPNCGEAIASGTVDTEKKLEALFYPYAPPESKPAPVKWTTQETHAPSGCEYQKIFRQESYCSACGQPSECIPADCEDPWKPKSLIIGSITKCDGTEGYGDSCCDPASIPEAPPPREDTYVDINPTFDDPTTGSWSPSLGFNLQDCGSKCGGTTGGSVPQTTTLSDGSTQVTWTYDRTCDLTVEVSCAFPTLTWNATASYYTACPGFAGICNPNTFQELDNATTLMSQSASCQCGPMPSCGSPFLGSLSQAGMAKNWCLAKQGGQQRGQGPVKIDQQLHSFTDDECDCANQLLDWSDCYKDCFEDSICKACTEVSSTESFSNSYDVPNPCENFCDGSCVDVSL